MIKATTTSVLAGVAFVFALLAPTLGAAADHSKLAALQFALVTPPGDAPADKPAKAKQARITASSRRCRRTSPPART